MSHLHIEMTEALSGYVREVSLREPEPMARLRAETASMAKARMQITPEQGQFLQLLVGLLGARKTLEIGVFTGYSALAVALALPEGGRIVACDISEEFTSIGRRYWQEMGVLGKIDLRLGPAMETLDALILEESGSFDLAFIDADKISYDGYYERALQLLRPGGLVAIDNVLWHSKVLNTTDPDEDTRAIQALNRKLHSDARVQISLLPIGDGLTLARKL